MEARGNAEQHLDFPTAFVALNQMMALVLLVLMVAIKAVELCRLALAALSVLVVLFVQEALMVLVAAYWRALLFKDLHCVPDLN